MIGLSDFLTNFKSKKFKKFFNHEKEFKRENYFNQKIFKKNIEKDFKNNLKNKLKTGALSLNSGITLIALIITIIVLLILAGVTIALVVRR